MAKKKIEKEIEKKPTKLIYVGPKLKDEKIPLDRFAVLDEIPAVLNEKIKEYPAFNSLFIDVEEFPSKKVDIMTNKGIYGIITKEIIERGY